MSRTEISMTGIAKERSRITNNILSSSPICNTHTSTLCLQSMSILLYIFLVMFYHLFGTRSWARELDRWKEIEEVCEESKGRRRWKIEIPQGSIMRNAGDVLERAQQENGKVMSLEMSFVWGIHHSQTSLCVTSIFCIKIVFLNPKHIV